MLLLYSGQYLAHRKYFKSICYYLSIKIQLGTVNSACKGGNPPTLQSPESETRLPVFKLSKGERVGNINCIKSSLKTYEYSFTLLEVDYLALKGRELKEG